MLENRALEIIDDIIYITVATICSDNTPWNSPVYTAFDNELNFYWASWTENQHSLNLENNENTFCVVYDSKAPEGTGEGVYLKGKTVSLSKKEQIVHALDTLDTRVGKEKGSERSDPFISGVPRKIYKFVPEQVWMNDEGSRDGEYIDVRREIDMQKLKDLLR